MTTRRLKVLCCADHFLPGHAGGGTIRTIANIQKLLPGELELTILTRDRDLGAAAAYEGISANNLAMFKAVKGYSGRSKRQHGSKPKAETSEQ